MIGDDGEAVALERAAELLRKAFGIAVGVGERDGGDRLGGCERVHGPESSASADEANAAANLSSSAIQAVTEGRDKRPVEPVMGRRVVNAQVSAERPDRDEPGDRLRKSISKVDKSVGPSGSPRRRYRTIWISDIHLGTRGCNASC